MEYDRKEEQVLDLSILAGDILRQARQMMAFGMALVLLCSVLIGARSYRAYSPVYEATASFTVRVANPLYSSISSYNIKTAEQMAATFPYILTSGVLRERVQKALGSSYLPYISVVASGGTSIITIRVQDSDPQFAYDVLNAVIEYYPEVAEFVVGPTILLMLDESGVPTAPTTRFRFFGPVVKGAMMGAGIWAVIVVIFALSRNTIHNEDELKRVLNLPCIGHLPAVRLAPTQIAPMVVEGDDRFGFTTSIRLLTLRVEKQMAERSSKVLLISSAIPGEGKTTISVNIALTMAKKGKKILLMDCDPYNPSVSKMLPDTSEPEEEDSEYISRKFGAIRATAYENLSIYSGFGTKVGDSTKDFQKHIAKLIASCRDEYDCIILDTPPCSLLADAAEISNLAECGLMVIRQDFSSWDQILDGARSLNGGSLYLIGCCLNNMRRAVSGQYGGDYGYGYGYGSGYGYGYGYGAKSQGKDE